MGGGVKRIEGCVGSHSRKETPEKGMAKLNGTELAEGREFCHTLWRRRAKTGKRHVIFIKKGKFWEIADKEGIGRIESENAELAERGSEQSGQVLPIGKN